MKKIIILISFLILSCNSDVKSDSPILNFQNELIENEITGSNVFKMVKGDLEYGTLSFLVHVVPPPRKDLG